MKKLKQVWRIGSLLIIVFAVFFLISGNVMPPLQIPNPTMPRENAFDRFVKAGKLIKEGKAIGEAASALAKTGGNKPSQAELQKLVKENAPAIAVLQEGLKYPYLNPPIRSFDTLFPYYKDFRVLSRLMGIKGRTEATQGDYDQAVKSWIDGMEMSVLIPHGSPLIGMLVGIACESISRYPFWERGIDHLNAQQAKNAITRLEKMENTQVSYMDSLREEKWAMQAGLLEIFQNPKWKPVLDREDKAEGQNEEQLRTGTRLLMNVIGKGRILNNITGYMDALVSIASKPYAAHLPEPPEPKDPISKIFIPVFSQARIKWVENKAQTSLLIVALALRAYHEEKHTYPAFLEELAPAYLKRLPDDPYALKGGFQYKKEGEHFLLYSVGPDGRDDGGKPIDDPARAKSSNPKLRYYADAKSRGDIVVGINTH